MKKAVRIALVALALPLILLGRSGMAPVASPATPGAAGPPPPVVLVVNFLGLSESQQAQLGELVSGLQSTVGDLEKQIEPKQSQLETLVNSTTPDPQAVGALFLEIQALNRQVAQAIQSFQQQFVEFLTDDQRAKFGAVQQAAQLQPVLGAFAALHLVVVPPAPSPGMQ